MTNLSKKSIKEKKCYIITIFDYCSYDFFSEEEIQNFNNYDF